MQLLDIERELTGRDSDIALKQYDEILVRLDERIGDALREGLSPDDYARVEQLREANLVARKLLRLATREN